MGPVKYTLICMAGIIIFSCVFVLAAVALLMPDCYPAELLVKAQLTETQAADPDAFTEIGDVIMVRPDGWVWGKEERPPRYIVVKMPGFSVDKVKVYEESLMDTTSASPEDWVRIKRRKYKFPSATLSAAIVSGTVTLTEQQVKSAVITKSVTP